MNAQACSIILTKIVLYFAGICLLFSANLYSEESSLLNNKIAINLSYDDTLASRLNNALPALNRRNINASFYVSPLSNAFENRIEEWKLLAKQGHELGNHTLFHACRGDMQGREWVDPFNALEGKTISDMMNEVRVTNTLLKSLDGQSIRTFTPPSFDKMAMDGN